MNKGQSHTTQSTRLRQILGGTRLRPTKLFIGLYLSLLVLLFFYSFTQIDLGLTMTRASIFTGIQKAFQYVGYFNRPLSALLFIFFLIGLFSFYGLYLFFATRGLLSKKAVWITILAVTVILALSYNAFSYDIFNYIFDAKIFTNYHQNPYIFKALDFPNDPMLAFMHWTQRTYPYGPTWLLVSVPLSFLGLQYFLPTYFLFKVLAAVCFVGTVYMIGKIMQTIAPDEEVFSLVFFALNPLVIIEALISGHNDIVMMFFAMASLFFLVRRRYIFSFVFLLFSIGIKYATGFLLPLYAAIFLFDRKKVPVNWQTLSLTFIAAMVFAVIAATLRTNFQPWYLLFVLPFAAIVARRFYIVIPTLFMTLAALLTYLPFLYTGNWDPPIPTILNEIILGGVALSLIVTAVLYLIRHQKKVSAA